MSKLIDAITSANQEDLDQLDEQIAECEKTLAALKSARQVIDRRLNGVKKREARAKASPAKSTDKGEPKLADRIYDLLSKEGPLTVEKIAYKLGVKKAAVGASLHHAAEWFNRLPMGQVEIATTQT